MGGRERRELGKEERRERKVVEGMEKRVERERGRERERERERTRIVAFTDRAGSYG